MSGVVGVIQARYGSERLRGKILAPVGDGPLLDLLFARIRDAPVDEWWLATTREPADDATAAWGERAGVEVLRGETDDVLSRFVAILGRSRAELVLRITADDPFVDGAAIDCLVQQADRLSQSSGVLQEGVRRLPLGYLPQLARTRAVLELDRRIPADRPHHRTHVLSYLAEVGEVAHPALPPDWPSRPDWRWTVDTERDLQMTREAFACFGDRAHTIGYPEMVARLDRHAEIVAINADVRQKSLEEG